MEERGSHRFFVCPRLAEIIVHAKMLGYGIVQYHLHSYIRMTTRANWGGGIPRTC